MAEPQHQALSALMDGELDADQAETLVDALCRDDALAAEWHRMHRLRGLVQGGDFAGFDVTAAVRAALADEPVYLLPVPLRRSSRWPRYVMGGALAASVALLTVIGLREWQTTTEAPQLAGTGASPAMVAVGGEAAPVVAAPSRLESYWAMYAENALFAGQDTPSLARSVRVDQTR